MAANFSALHDPITVPEALLVGHEENDEANRNLALTYEAARDLIVESVEIVGGSLSVLQQMKPAERRTYVKNTSGALSQSISVILNAAKTIRDAIEERGGQAMPLPTVLVEYEAYGRRLGP